MRTILTAAALFMTFATQAVAVSGASGYMTCKVKTQYLLKVAEGEINTYSGFTGGINVEDTIKFEYQAGKHSDTDYSLFRVKITTFSGKRISFLPQYILDVSDVDNFKSWTISTGGAGIQQGPNSILTNTIIAQTDSFQFNGLFYEAAFERYFKNDWTGILLNRMGLDVHVVALDCRHNNDQLDRFINTMKFAIERAG